MKPAQAGQSIVEPRAHPDMTIQDTGVDDEYILCATNTDTDTGHSIDPFEGLSTGQRHLEKPRVQSRHPAIGPANPVRTDMTCSEASPA